MRLINYQNGWLTDPLTVQLLDAYQEIEKGRWIYVNTDADGLDSYSSAAFYIGLRIIGPGIRKTAFGGRPRTSLLLTLDLQNSGERGVCTLWPLALLDLLNNPKSRTGTLKWLRWQ